MSLVDKVIMAISSHEDYEEVMKTVRKNAYGPTLLVGGKVYRTVSEIIHGTECGSKDADWDVLIMGDVKTAYVPSGWNAVTSYYPGSKTNSLGLVKQTRKYSAKTWVAPIVKIDNKIDMIGIRDIPGDGTLNSYFKVVPLDVQRIALDIEKRQLFGPVAINAIKRRNVKINSTKGCLPRLDIKRYIVDKATSLGYTYEGQVVSKKPCDCYGNDTKSLWDYGCKLPQFHS